LSATWTPTSARITEAHARAEFIDPFFEAPGWDVRNTQGYAESYKDVVHEDAIKVGGKSRAPDYSFRVGGARKFFLEATKPSVFLQDDVGPAYQLRRYSWSVKKPLLAAIALTLLLTSCGQPTETPAPTAETMAAAEIRTATGLSVEENVEQYGIPAVIVPFDYPVPDGMIENPAEREAMIEAKIAHLEEVNKLYWGEAPGTLEERQALFSAVSHH
jgi:hypothetical protein